MCVCTIYYTHIYYISNVCRYASCVPATVVKLFIIFIIIITFFFQVHWTTDCVTLHRLILCLTYIGATGPTLLGRHAHVHVVPIRENFFLCHTSTRNHEQGRLWTTPFPWLYSISELYIILMPTYVHFTVIIVLFLIFLSNYSSPAFRTIYNTEIVLTMIMANFISSPVKNF